MGVTAARGLLGTGTLVGRSLGRGVWFLESASLRGECHLPLVFDTGTTRMRRSDRNVWLGGFFYRLRMRILSRSSYKGSGVVERRLNSRR